MTKSDKKACPPSKKCVQIRPPRPYTAKDAIRICANNHIDVYMLFGNLAYMYGLREVIGIVATVLSWWSKSWIPVFVLMITKNIRLIVKGVAMLRLSRLTKVIKYSVTFLGEWFAGIGFSFELPFAAETAAFIGTVQIFMGILASFVSMMFAFTSIFTATPELATFLQKVYDAEVVWTGEVKNIGDLVSLIGLANDAIALQNQFEAELVAAGYIQAVAA